ncbi:MAG: Asp-tRNA(Asn)/Glu-tRNA(Gln) amidotransferase subunit GatB [Burkholderiales bacterium]|jgi:aspartyl-tRNA(Asn)/glutamyl-tRNA(Gln) amidotransferase subunit B|nr:Asp-tRNA(Asn)/Glu-tRNA(Gln) amidotransferase subunit GatB [Burkholderiales bacterium]
MTWQTVIGLETHAQLTTESKMFSAASAAFGAPPNTHACAVDLALPGVLPVVNQEAVLCAIKFGLAVNATVNERSVFARKNYFYPDLPKGYQISQFEIPIVLGGGLSIATKNGEKFVRLTRAHLEEDAGKSLHEDFHGMTGIDLNRAGTPLLEIVTEPDMSSAEEAVAYAKALHALVRWIGICDGNMQEGSFRCDANVSVRRAGEPLGTRAEIKNLNSFKFLEKAILFEVERQIEIIENGGKVVQETRLFDPDRGETRSMRSKEDAQDYRYFPDPDLPPLVIPAELLSAAQKALPELPEAMKKRFIDTFGLPEYDAAQLTRSLEFARYFEEVLQNVRKDHTLAVKDAAKIAANQMLGELSATLNREEKEIEASSVSPKQLADIVTATMKNTISGKGAKDVFQALWAAGEPMTVEDVIKNLGLQQISDTGALEKWASEVIAQNPAIVAEYRSGKEKAFNSLVGQVMKASRGKANPAQVNEILKRLLG